MIVEALKRKDLDSLFEYFKIDEVTFLEEITPYISKDSYFNINRKGEVKLENINLSFLLLNSFFKIRKIIPNNEMEEKLLKFVLSFMLDNLSYSKKIKKIDRLSSLTTEVIKRNFFKTTLKQETHFSLRYGQEFFLRDRVGFYEDILFFGAINLSLRKNSNSFNPNYKILFSGAMIEMIEHMGKGNFFSPIYTSLSFLSSYPNDTYIYEHSYNLFNMKLNNNETHSSNKMMDLVINSDNEFLIKSLIELLTETVLKFKIKDSSIYIDILNYICIVSKLMKICDDKKIKFVIYGIFEYLSQNSTNNLAEETEEIIYDPTEEEIINLAIEKNTPVVLVLMGNVSNLNMFFPQYKLKLLRVCHKLIF